MTMEAEWQTVMVWEGERGRGKERHPETGRERDFTANRPGGFNHSKTLNSYWGYKTFYESSCAKL